MIPAKQKISMLMWPPTFVILAVPSWIHYFSFISYVFFHPRVPSGDQAARAAANWRTQTCP